MFVIVFICGNNLFFKGGLIVGLERVCYFVFVFLGCLIYDCLVFCCIKDLIWLVWKNRSFFIWFMWIGLCWWFRFWFVLIKVYVYIEFLFLMFVNVVGNKFMGMVWIGFVMWWILSGCIVVFFILLIIDVLLGNFFEDKVLDVWFVEVFWYMFI